MWENKKGQPGYLQLLVDSLHSPDYPMQIQTQV